MRPHSCRLVFLAFAVAAFTVAASPTSAIDKNNGSWKARISSFFEWEGIPIPDLTQGSNEGNLFAGDTVPDWITGDGVAPMRGATNGTGVRISGVMMQRPEVALVASYLKENDTMLEWGSGGSTLVFGQMVASYDSIEHNCSFTETVRDQIDDLFALPPVAGNNTAERSIRTAEQKAERIRVHCSQIPRGTGNWGLIHGFEHGSYRQFKSYVDAVDLLARGLSIDGAYYRPNNSNQALIKFDKVLIDGRARMACALRVLPYLKPTSVVFLHDFYTRVDLYSGLLDYYDEVSRVLAYPNEDPRMGQPEEPQGLVVLKRKTSVTDSTLPLTDVDINAHYDKINWRGSDPKPPLTRIDRLVYQVASIVDLRNWRRLRSQNALYEAVMDDVRTCLFLAVLVYIVQSNLLRAKIRQVKRPFRRGLSRQGPSGGNTASSGGGQTTGLVHPIGGEMRQRPPRSASSATHDDQAPGHPNSSPTQDVTLVDSDAVSRAANRRRGSRVSDDASGP